MSVGYVLEKVKANVGKVTYDELLENFGEFEDISFDYKIVENAGRVAMVEYKGKWKDLGTWNTLTEEMDENYLGKTIVGETCENTHVINELAIPIVALGTKNMVIAM